VLPKHPRASPVSACRQEWRVGESSLAQILSHHASEQARVGRWRACLDGHKRSMRSSGCTPRSMRPLVSYCLGAIPICCVTAWISPDVTLERIRAIVRTPSTSSVGKLHGRKRTARRVDPGQIEQGTVVERRCVASRSLLPDARHDFMQPAPRRTYQRDSLRELALEQWLLS